MKILKKISITALTMAITISNAQAIPTFTTLVAQANGAGANITESIWNTTALGYDSLWASNANSELKFKSEISGYDNKMGYADASGMNQVVVLNEGGSPGNWISIAAAPNPFTLFLDTGAGHTLFSDDSLNSDGLDHLLVFQRLNGDSKYLLFWDDQLNGGDGDYNDFVARANYIEVPEPSAIALFGLALLGFSYSRKRTAVK